jgi:Zn finger protein HypA/HybF involved in hydrogenase expression
MKNEISIPVLKEEDSVAAKIRRDNYSMGRDIQATEFNEAIAARLLAEQKICIKCEKCGKEFESNITEKDLKFCPECS